MPERTAESREQAIAEIVRNKSFVFKEGTLGYENAKDIALKAYGAGRSAGLEEAAQKAESMAKEYSAASTERGDYQYGKAVAANSVAAAIRNLKET